MHAPVYLCENLEIILILVIINDATGSGVIIIHVTDAVLDLGVREQRAKVRLVHFTAAQLGQLGQVRLGQRGVDAVEAERRLVEHENQFGGIAVVDGAAHARHPRQTPHGSADHLQIKILIRHLAEVAHLFVVERRSEIQHRQIGARVVRSGRGAGDELPEQRQRAGVVVGDEPMVDVADAVVTLAPEFLFRIDSVDALLQVAGAAAAAADPRQVAGAVDALDAFQS